MALKWDRDALPIPAPLHYAAMSVEVSRVTGGQDLRAFIELPFRLHADTPWVPPLRIERRMFLNRRFNPYFKHGEAEYFLARRDGAVVGRITAQIDHAFNDFHNSRWGMFGFLEFEDDQQVLDALLEAAASWLTARRCERMVGPMDFSLNDESGVLTEGFELEPLIRQPWHPPYYKQRCEAAGLDKAMDLYSWALSVEDRDQAMPGMFRLADQANEHGIKIRKMSRRHLRRDLDLFAEVYNSAWSQNWGFVPYSKEDLDGYALELQLIYTPEWFMVAELDGEPIAAAITVMDLNQVLRKMNGRLLPFGWWHFLRRHKICDRLRVGFLGVKPEYQRTGVAAALYVEHFNAAASTPLKGGEAGWILETNIAMNRGIKAMNGRIVKRYRLFERML
jgi:GNAT superfamily N-acetyltransferase